MQNVSKYFLYNLKEHVYDFFVILQTRINLSRKRNKREIFAKQSHKS